MPEATNTKFTMSRTGFPYDNAHMDSFSQSSNKMSYITSNYQTLDDVTQRLPLAYTISVCIRLLGYLSPEEYKRRIPKTQNSCSPFPQISVKPLQLDGRSPVTTTLTLLDEALQYLIVFLKFDIVTFIPVVRSVECIYFSYHPPTPGIITAPGVFFDNFFQYGNPCL